MATRVPLREHPHTPRFKSASAARNKKGKRFGPSRSANYLEYVRARACCVCGAPGPSHAHHHGPRGMGQKTSDFRTVPLCSAHHDHWHTQGHFGHALYTDRRSSLELVHATIASLLVTWLEAMEAA